MRRIDHTERLAAHYCLDLDLRPSPWPGHWRWRFKVLDRRLDEALGPEGDAPGDEWWESGSALPPADIGFILAKIHESFGGDARRGELPVYVVAGPDDAVAAVLAPQPPRATWPDLHPLRARQGRDPAEPVANAIIVPLAL